MLLGEAGFDNDAEIWKLSLASLSFRFNGWFRRAKSLIAAAAAQSSGSASKDPYHVCLSISHDIIPTKGLWTEGLTIFSCLIIFVSWARKTILSSSSNLVPQSRAGMVSPASAPKPGG